MPGAIGSPIAATIAKTPQEAVLALLRVERLPHRIWEPACGPGAIVKVLRAAGHDVVAADSLITTARIQNRGSIS